MTAAAMQLDFQACRTRTRWSMSASLLGHLLVAIWFALMPRPDAEQPALTEITLIEPGELTAGPAGAAAPAVQTNLGAAVRSAIDASFRRLTQQGDINPRPESEAAFDDRLEARLATLQREAAVPSPTVQVPGTPNALWSSPALGSAGSSGGSARVALTRGGEGGGGPALTLTRGGGRGASPGMMAATLPAGKSAADAPAQGGDVTARRSLAGAMLAGPIADRGVLSYATPVYPDWAKREAVEGSVTLYFVVRPDGSVKENILVQKTAGFEDFDESARTALRAWRFEPLHGGRTGEQWGTITFHFRLREAG
ncbi:MAG TPA: energy transducer TonB [Candidatus Eisenbacteria bacterium]|jgi:TonB family protein